MKTTLTEPKRDEAFTLVEMIGMLSIIAILATFLVPKVFASISEARVCHAVGCFNTVKEAAAMYYAKYNLLGGPNGVALSLPATNWDVNVLFREGLLDKPFSPRLGEAPCVQVVSATNTSYDLDGNGSADTGTSGTVLECKLSNVGLDEAFDLSRWLDGVEMSTTNLTSLRDTKGRVKYDFGAEAGVVYLYVTHY